MTQPDPLAPLTAPAGPYNGFSTWSAYQAARRRELTRQRILNLRATNRHLSLADIAYHTGVSTARVLEVLAGQPTRPL